MGLRAFHSHRLVRSQSGLMADSRQTRELLRKSDQVVLEILSLPMTTPSQAETLKRISTDTTAIAMLPNQSTYQVFHRGPEAGSYTPDNA